MLHKSARVRHSDLMIVKLIACSGLYPQLAISDEYNYCKSGGQQFFHTRLKPFVSLYPNEYFSQHYDQLKLNDSDIITKPHYYTPRHVLSERHQILCFQNLMETTKPYIMNCMPMPAAQTLLLFSHQVETNASITQIVFDEWLSLDFPIPETACNLLCRAIEIRTLWSKLLDEKLIDTETGKNATETDDKLTRELRDALVDYMHTKITYTIKRLLPADLKSIYTRNCNSEHFKLKINPFCNDFEITHNTEKGGLNVAENITYGCLQEIQWTNALECMLAEQSWQCSACDFTIPMSAIKKLEHIKICLKLTKGTAETTVEIKQEVKELKLSKIELLRARKRSS